jgi:hypothetical protein
MTREIADPAGHPDPDSTPLERALLAYRHGRTLPASELDVDEQQLVDDLLPWIDALHDAAEAIAETPPEPDAHAVREPIRNDDPVALMLGLVPDRESIVDGRKLAHARKRANLDLGQLLDRLRARGWEVSTKEGLRWELGGQTALAPALITAIASELAVDETALVASSRDRDRSGLHDLFDDARVSAFLADWAAEASVDSDRLRQRASATLAAAAHRNRTGGSVEALLDVLRTLRAIPDFLDTP